MSVESEYIKLHRTREDITYQLNLIRHLQNFNQRREFGGVTFGILVITVFALAINLLAPPNTWVELKGVITMLTAIIWVVALPIGLWVLSRRYRTSQWIRSCVEKELTGDKEYFMSFNEEGITHSSDSYKMQMKWTHFHHYLVSPSAIFLFDYSAITGFISFSTGEIGAENLERLKTIVKEKLPVLNQHIILK